MTETQDDANAAGTYSIAASLTPAEAEAVRDGLLAALAEAAAAGQPLTIEAAEAGDPAQLSPCALQLIAAAVKSTQAAGLGISLGPSAKAALEGAGGLEIIPA